MELHFVYTSVQHEVKYSFFNKGFSSLSPKDKKNIKNAISSSMFQVIFQISNFSQESQFPSSYRFFVTIIALLICSNVTNITTFHDPSLRNEGTNLQKTNEIENAGVTREKRQKLVQIKTIKSRKRYVELV